MTPQDRETERNAVITAAFQGGARTVAIARQMGISLRLVQKVVKPLRLEPEKANPDAHAGATQLSSTPYREQFIGGRSRRKGAHKVDPDN